MDKKTIRQTLHTRRRTLPAHIKKKWDKRINDRLIQWIDTQKAACIGFYWPLPDEPDISPSIIACWKNNQCIALPKTYSDKRIKFFLYTPSTRLEKDAFNILSPTNAPLMIPDIYIIPCVGFHPHKYRIGYGSGCFDRHLEKHSSSITLGIAYECLALPSHLFPFGPYDRPLSMILTEKDIY